MIRAVVGAVIGALAGSAALTVATFLDPSISIDFDTDVPVQVASGFYPAERTTQETYAWTAALATITLRGVDREVPWRCIVRLRGAHPGHLPQPDAAIGIDGITVRTEPAGHEYRDFEVDAVASPRASSLSLTIRTTPTFVPGPADKRELGVQVDRIRCAPAGGARVGAPRGALHTAAWTGSAFGALFALLAPLSIATAAVVVLSAAAAVVISRGMAAYSAAYLAWIVPIALWITVPVLAFGMLRSWRGRPLHPASAFVLAFSSGVLFLKIIALLHPSKDVVDAVFHAHRFDAVLAGHYFFTQPMPGGVRFPYAIGLYVTAAPFGRLVADHVALLRIVVCAFEAVAAGLLYVAVVKSWKDHVAAACAVVLYHSAPLPYAIVGNANLTFAFAQSISAMTLVTATVVSFRSRWLLSAVALMMIAALAFLSHVGVFPVVAVSLVALAGFYFWRGGPDLGVASSCVLGATLIAAALAIGLYYGRFPEVWNTLDRVRSPIAAAPAESVPPGGSNTGPAPLSIAERATRAAAHGRDAYGLPLLMLAIPGLWLAWRGTRDRLTLGLTAWGAAFAVFVAFRILAPVDARLQRYADEFIDRLYYMLLPVVAILAARASAASWRSDAVWRVAGIGLVLAAAVIGVQKWAQWIR